jgi:hypothetical protein
LVPTAAQAAALEELYDDVPCFLKRAGSVLTEEAWSIYIKGRTVIYSGDAVLKARPLSWAQISAALPPSSRCASIEALDLAEQGMHDFLSQPGKKLVDTIDTLDQAARILKKEMATGGSSFLPAQGASSLAEALGAMVQASMLNSADAERLSALAHQSADSDEDSLGPPRKGRCAARGCAR